MKITRNELMILAGIVIFTASATIPAFYRLRDHLRLRDTVRGMERLLNAGARYKTEYGVWPTTRSRGEGDVRFGSERFPNREVLNALRAVEGEGNEEHVANPRRVIFLDWMENGVGAIRLSPEGDILDAWGMPYQIVLDTNLDGICDVTDSVYSGGIDGGMIIWSSGPDRKSDTMDDVRSWRR